MERITDSLGRFVSIDPIQRFHQKYKVNDETGCWEWQDQLLHNGYGRLQINSKSVKAHRFAYETFIGPIRNDLVVCHNCNNRQCVNPEHLRQDTIQSNSLDMVKINSHPNQILSEDEVIQIKKSLQNSYRGQIGDLAHFYKVSQRTISSIKTGSTWSHVSIS